MADEGTKTPKRNAALLSGEYGSALPLMVPHDRSLDPEEDSAGSPDRSLPEISRSFDDLSPSAAELPDDEEAFEEDSFWEEVSSDGEEDEDSRSTLDDDEDAPADETSEYEAADTAEIEQVEPPVFPYEQTLRPTPTTEATPAAFDPLEESTPWVQPTNYRRIAMAIATVTILAVGIGGWFLWLSNRGPTGGDRTPGNLAHASMASSGMGASVLPILPAPQEADAATLDSATATETDIETERSGDPAEIETEIDLEAETELDGLAEVAAPVEVLPAAPILAPTVGDPWATPDSETDAPPAVELHHAPIEQVVVGDKILVRITTPGLEDCQVHLYWHRPGEGLQQRALYRSGASHSLVMTIAPEMGPVFEYFLVATGCGAAVWPADGTTQTVAVR